MLTQEERMLRATMFSKHSLSSSGESMPFYPPKCQKLVKAKARLKIPTWQDTQKDYCIILRSLRLVEYLSVISWFSYEA